MAILRKNPTAVTAAKAPAQASVSAKTSAVFGKAKQINEHNKVQGDARRERVFDLAVTPGKPLDVVILDREPYSQYEHVYQKDGRWDGFAKCLAERGHCPACTALGREGTFTVRLTVLDPTPYVGKRGDNAGKEVTLSRKSLAIKTMMASKWERLLMRHATEQAGYRGIVVRLHRDNAKEARSGSEVEYLKTLSEDEIKAYIARKEPSVDRRAELLRPVDYAKAYPTPTEEELRRQFGVRGSLPGSEEFEEHNDDVLDDEIPF